MTLFDILEQFPCEAIHISEGKRSFYPPCVGSSSNVLFDWLDESQTIAIGNQTYKIDDMNIVEALSKMYSKLELDKDTTERLRKTYQSITSNQRIIENIKYSDNYQSDFIQREMLNAGEDPSQLEHFTDWLVEYLDETSLWQLRYPGRIAKVCVLSENNKIDHNSGTRLFTRYATFGNIDDERDIFFVKLVYDFYFEETDQNAEPVDEDLNSVEVFFHHNERSSNPVDHDDFYLWHKVFVLKQEVFDDDDEDDDYDDDETV